MRRRLLILAAWLLGAGLAAATPAAAQRLDEGTLVIRESRAEIGRETFSVLDGRGRGLPGTTLSTQAEFPARAPRSTRTLLLYRDAGGHVTGLEMEAVAERDTMRLVGEVLRDRLTVRIIRGARESARQYPAGAELVVLPDSLPSAYLQFAALATPAGQVLTVVDPETGQRRSAQAIEEPPAAGEGRVVRVTGDLEARVVLDPEGRLLEVELPDRRLRARRLGR